MDKISHILPPSRRVVAMDAESSQPVRPGAPDFGRPTRHLDIQDRVSLSANARDRGDGSAEPPATYKNPKEGARAKAVEELAEKFFNPTKFAKEGEGSLSEEVLKNMDDNKMFSPAPPAAKSAAPVDDGGLKEALK